MLRISTLAAVLLLVSCASGPRSAPSPFSGRADNTGSRSVEKVQVLNNAFEEATIYAISGSWRVRAGNVPGVSDRILSFRWPSSNRRVRFEIDFLAGPTCFTNELDLISGDILQLQLPADPSRTPGCNQLPG